MSLYNDIADSLSKQGLNNSLGGGVDAITKGAGAGIKQVFGGGQFGDAISGMGTSMARNAAISVANKYIPPNMQRLGNTASGVVGDVMRGDFNRAGLRILDSGLLRDFLPGGMDNIAAQARYWGTPTPLFGGISPTQAREIYNEARDNKYCRKNLWLIEVNSKLGGGDFSSRFNLFATELEYAPYTLSGEKRKVGAAHIDIINSSDPVELQITTLDDEQGSMKNWFIAHHMAAANRDGTVGLPDDYAINISIVHGFITRDSNSRGYEDKGKFRPANINMSLSRREDGLQEIQLTFVQLDTFLK